MNPFDITLIQDLVEQSLLEEPTGNQWLDTRYNEHIAIIGHTNPYYRLFYRIAQTLKPEFVVELGSWRGDASAHFAVGNPDGDVVAVDIHKDNDFAGQAKLQEAVNLLPNMTWLQMWSWDAVETIRAIDKSISVLFIDAWHDYQYAKKEWDLYLPLLADKALIICDDITAAYNFDGMLRFWEEMPEPKFLDNRIHAGVPMGFVEYNKTYNYPEILDKYFPEEIEPKYVEQDRGIDSTQPTTVKRRGRPPKKS